MRAMSLKLKSYAGAIGAISIVNNNNIQRRALRSILASFGILSVCYLLILGSMVFNIVARKNLEDQARVLTDQVSTMELSYLSLSNNIDLSLSHALGFKETDIKFATRKALSSIKLTQNEI